MSCLFLWGSERGTASGPVELGLSHTVSTGGGLEPGIVGVSTTLLVEKGVVFEDTSLLDVLLVVGGLLGGLFGTDLLVLVGSQTSRNVRLFGDVTNDKLCSF